MLTAAGPELAPQQVQVRAVPRLLQGVEEERPSTADACAQSHAGVTQSACDRTRRSGDALASCGRCSRGAQGSARMQSGPLVPLGRRVGGHVSERACVWPRTFPLSSRHLSCHARGCGLPLRHVSVSSQTRWAARWRSAMLVCNIVVPSGSAETVALTRPPGQAFGP